MAAPKTTPNEKEKNQNKVHDLKDIPDRILLEDIRDILQEIPEEKNQNEETIKDFVCHRLQAENDKNVTNRIDYLMVEIRKQDVTNCIYSIIYI